MSARIYVGNLPLDIRERELDDLFYKYGRILEIDLKTPHRPPAFAFITFDHPRDADDACRGRDNYNFDGYRLRVEFAKGDRRDRGRDGRDRFDGPPPRQQRTGARRSEWGVEVANLPQGCSWQDLKDFMRKAGDVIYADVDKQGGGVVEFTNRDDMEYALRSLHDTEFRNRNDATNISVMRRGPGGGGAEAPMGAGKARGRSPSRSPSPAPQGRDRSRSRSRDRLRSPRSRSRSPRSRSRSPRSRSRSPSPRDATRDRADSAGDRGTAAEDDSRRSVSPQN